MDSKAIRNFLRSFRRLGRRGLLLSSPHPARPPPPAGDSARVFRSFQQGGKGRRGPPCAAPRPPLRGLPPTGALPVPPWARPTPGSAPPHSPCWAREPHGEERHCQYPPGPGVSTTSAAAGSSLEPGDGMSISGSPDSCRLAAPVSSRGRIPGPRSPRGRRGVWSLPPRLCCSALPARGSPDAAHARSPPPPPPRPGAELVLRCPLTFSFSNARPTACRLACGSPDRAAGVHPSAAVPLDRPATWSHASHGHWTPFCHCEGRLGPPRVL